MAKQFAQEVDIDAAGRMKIPYDWYADTLPVNMDAESHVYFDTAYSFRSFHSEQPVGLKLGFASGNYGRSAFVCGKKGVITVGKFVVLEATNLICQDAITIGDHCMFSWGSVVTDSWIDPSMYSPAVRKALLEKAAMSTERLVSFDRPRPVVIEDNVWVGFDAVILPGVRLGHGCVVGCKTIIDSDVPPYAVIGGSPARIIKFLEKDDTEEERQRALHEYLKLS